MKKIIGIVLTLVLAVGLLAGCGTIITTNQDRDMQQVIIEVNGVKITKEAFYNEYMNYVYTMYYSYGISPDNSSYASMFTEQANTILEDLISAEIDKQKAINEYKITLTEEEMAEARKEADEAINEVVESYAEQLAAASASPSPSPSPTPSVTASATATATPSRTPKPAPTASPSPSPIPEDLLAEAREMYMNELKESGQTVEDIYEEYYLQKKISKLEDLLAEKAAKVTDAELKELYDQTLAKQKENIEKDVTSVESVTDTILVYPEGYRTVKHILIKIDDTASSAISALRKEAETLETNAEKEADETKKADLLKQAEEKNKEADAKLAEELTTIQKRSESILAEVKSGTLTFDELIMKHGEDPGMFTTDDDGNQKVVEDKEGYLLSSKTTSYMENFTEASVALEDVGDVTELVATDYGYHIIKMVAKNEGEVAYDDVKDELRKQQEEANRTTYLSTVRTEWRSAAKVTIYKDRLSNLVNLT